MGIKYAKAMEDKICRSEIPFNPKGEWRRESVSLPGRPATVPGSTMPNYDVEPVMVTRVDRVEDLPVFCRIKTFGAEEVCLEGPRISAITGVSIVKPAFDSCGNEKLTKIMLKIRRILVSIYPSVLNKAKKVMVYAYDKKAMSYKRNKENDHDKPKSVF